MRCIGYSGLSPDKLCTHPARFEVSWPFERIGPEPACGQHIGWILLSYGPNALAIIRPLEEDE